MVLLAGGALRGGVIAERFGTVVGEGFTAGAAVGRADFPVGSGGGGALRHFRRGGIVAEGVVGAKGGTRGGARGGARGGGGGGGSGGIGNRGHGVAEVGVQARLGGRIGSVYGVDEIGLRLCRMRFVSTKTQASRMFEMSRYLFRAHSGHCSALPWNAVKSIQRSRQQMRQYGCQRRVVVQREDFMELPDTSDAASTSRSERASFP